MLITIQQIKRSLEANDIAPLDVFKVRGHASVAMILTAGEQDLDMCFIKRANRNGDPWSGQVALPGGRAGQADRDAGSVAERETKEEIGMKLEPKECLGALPPIDVASNLHRQKLLLSPFVYLVDWDSKGKARVADPSEVDSVFWVPLSHLFDPSSGTMINYPSGAAGASYPGIAYDRYIIWGLTLRVLRSFGQVIGMDLPH